VHGLVDLVEFLAILAVVAQASHYFNFIVQRFDPAFLLKKILLTEGLDSKAVFRPFSAGVVYLLIYEQGGRDKKCELLSRRILHRSAH